ncbi:MAG TPA: glycosyltransferase [Roseimicrobium sp.]|nr:glycosyltransferase [Roseimicrobium sp.]
MQTTPAISIIVPTYNTGRYLPLLCESLLAQSCGDFEVLIGDDGSTDNTREVIAPFLTDPRFHLHSWTENRGLAAANKTLLSMVRGEFWCSPGADDLLRPDFLEKRLARMKAHPKAIIIHGPPEIIDEEGRVLAGQKLPQPAEPVVAGERALEQLLQHNTYNVPGIFSRSNALPRVLPHFTTAWRYAPDWFLWILLAATGGEVVWDPEPLHSYRVHSKSLTLDPAYDAHRGAEIRLAPMCALRAAGAYSEIARRLWEKWGRALYALWLRRSVKLRMSGQLQPRWVELGARAMHAGFENPPSWWREVIRCAPEMLRYSLAESRARKSQSFYVAGLAMVDDPVFRNHAATS